MTEVPAATVTSLPSTNSVTIVSEALADPPVDVAPRRLRESEEEFGLPLTVARRAQRRAALGVSVARSPDGEEGDADPASTSRGEPPDGSASGRPEGACFPAGENGVRVSTIWAAPMRHGGGLGEQSSAGRVSGARAGSQCRRTSVPLWRRESPSSGSGPSALFAEPRPRTQWNDDRRPWLRVGLV